MTKKEFMKELAALRNGWCTFGDKYDYVRRSGDHACPIRAVAKAGGIRHCGIITAGKRLGLADKTTDAIMYAADGVLGGTRDQLLKALGLTTPS